MHLEYFRIYPQLAFVPIETFVLLVWNYQIPKFQTIWRKALSHLFFPGSFIQNALQHTRRKSNSYTYWSFLIFNVNFSCVSEKPFWKKFYFNISSTSFFAYTYSAIFPMINVKNFKKFSQGLIMNTVLKKGNESS